MLTIVTESADAGLDWSPAGRSGEDLDTFTGARTYRYRWEQFGRSPHALYIAAFIDLDGDGSLGAGEPFGVFAGNPIVDAPWGSTAPASIADIVVDR